MISIHAPTRGATIHCKAKGTSDVFQSTLPREERRRTQMASRSLWNFNPRSHERSDHNAFRAEAVRRNFNPRSHERSDLRQIQSRPFMENFNPRSHERSDRCSPQESLQRLNFNPRSHERSDVYLIVNLKVVYYISIHAPTRGATFGT